MYSDWRPIFFIYLIYHIVLEKPVKFVNYTYIFNNILYRSHHTTQLCIYNCNTKWAYRRYTILFIYLFDILAVVRTKL